jgi:hypothetical protein
MENLNENRELKVELENINGKINNIKCNNAIEKIIVKEFLAILSGLAETIDNGSSSDIFKKTLSCFSKIERKEFIINNILEALKRGEKIFDIATRFTKLGLLDIGETGLTELKTLEEEKENKPKPTILKTLTSFLLNFQEAPLKLSKLFLTRLLNKIKDKIPEMVKIKFSLGFPCIPIIHFDTEDSASIGKILAFFQDTVEETNKTFFSLG